MSFGNQEQESMDSNPDPILHSGRITTLGLRTWTPRPAQPKGREGKNHKLDATRCDCHLLARASLHGSGASCLPQKFGPGNGMVFDQSKEQDGKERRARSAIRDGQERNSAYVHMESRGAALAYLVQSRTG